MLESDSFGLAEGFFFLSFFPLRQLCILGRKPFGRRSLWWLFGGARAPGGGGGSPFREIFSIIRSFIEGLFRGLRLRLRSVRLLFGKVFMLFVYISCFLTVGQ